MHTKSKELAYKEAQERKDIYKEFFEKTLEFDQVDIHVDCSRADMTEQLMSLRVKADEHERNRGASLEVLCIAVVNIGYNMVMDYGPHHFLKDLSGWKNVKTQSDGSKFEEHFCLTTEGEPVAVPEYAVNIANAGDKTFVITLIDWDTSKRSLIKPEHVTTDGKLFHNFVLDARPGYPRLTFVRNANCGAITQFFAD